MGQKSRRNRSISLRFRDKRIFAFNAEIQDGHQNWRETFFAKSHSTNHLRVRNFVEIALSRAISKNFASYTEIQDGRQKWRENFFQKKSPVHYTDTLWVKNFRQNRSILLCFRDKRVFAFYAEIQDGRQKWRENDFREKSPVHSADTLWVKKFAEIAPFPINAFLHLTQKFKMAAKSGGKMNFAKSHQ